MIIFILCLLIAPIISSSSTLTRSNFSTVTTDLDLLTDQSIIDDAWVNCMITAPVTINLIGQVMVVASRVDISFEQYSPNHIYKYIKYPKSFRGTLLQISNGNLSIRFHFHI